MVVGVVDERMPTGGSGGSQAAEDFNNDVYIPIGTAEGRFGKTVFLRQSGSRSGEQVEYSQVTLTVADIDEVRPAGEAIKTILDRPPEEGHGADRAARPARGGRARQGSLHDAAGA